MFVLIDNYDSFTYNLVHYLGQVGAETTVFRNDKISVQAILDLKPQGIVISPGPCDPPRAGICLDLVKAVADHNIPLLGVCLGHQSIAEALGAKIVRAPTPMHGKVDTIEHTEKGIFVNLPKRLKVTRYHSLIVDRDSLPAQFDVTAESDDKIIMALAHKNKPLFGVQFHPESIASEKGHDLLKNFLTLATH